jgi:branched-chain amino acid transport system ATP-binding protein
MLLLENMTKSFEGFMAVSDVSMRVSKGEICSIIGPNGAGKTTIFNLITGHLRSDRGAVSFKNREISRLHPYDIVRLGIGRSFQRLNIFPKLTVFQNVQAAVISHKRKGLNLFGRAEDYFRKETSAILEDVGLSDHTNTIGASLSYGYQKQLELGIALACEPELLMLDEPTAGMSAADTRNAISMIRRIVRDQGITLLIVEHDMEVVFAISEHIVVLHQGQIIKDGLPDEVRKDPGVQKLYLGENNDP